jgi:hypothetical protein
LPPDDHEEDRLGGVLKQTPKLNPAGQFAHRGKVTSTDISGLGRGLALARAFMRFRQFRKWLPDLPVV